MSVDDFTDDDVMIALPDDAVATAFDRRRCGIEDRYPGRALVNGLPAQLAILQPGRLEKSEGGALLVLAEHVQRKFLLVLDDLIGAGIGLHPDDHEWRRKGGLRDPIDRRGSNIALAVIR